MPFAVTLVASLGMEGKSTANELMDVWFESAPDILSDKFEQSMNRSISLSVRAPSSSEIPMPPLSSPSSPCYRREPPKRICVGMIPSAIADLSRAALLVENKHQNSDSPALFVIPVVHSSMQQLDQEQNPRIPEEIRKQIQSSCCQYVLDHACRFLDPTFPLKTQIESATSRRHQYPIHSLQFPYITSYCPIRWNSGSSHRLQLA
jgi:hypothetical protein